MRGDRIGLIGAERRRQIDAAEAHPGHARARRRRGAPRHAAQRRVFRPAAGAARSGSHGGRDRQSELGLDRRGRQAAGTSSVTSATSCFRRNAPIHRSGCCRAASATACCSRGSSRQPANVLVLDEPTNDLDIESLELLEQTLQDYTRHAAAGEPRPHVPRQRRDADAGARGRRPLARIRRRLRDWLRQRPSCAMPPPGRPASARQTGAAPAPTAAKTRASLKLSFKETRELAELPARDRGPRERTTRTGDDDVEPRLSQARHRDDAQRCRARDSARSAAGGGVRTLGRTGSEARAGRTRRLTLRSARIGMATQRPVEPQRKTPDGGTVGGFYLRAWQ